ACGASVPPSVWGKDSNQLLVRMVDWQSGGDEIMYLLAKTSGHHRVTERRMLQALVHVQEVIGDRRQSILWGCAHHGGDLFGRAVEFAHHHVRDASSESNLSPCPMHLRFTRSPT